MGSWPDLACGLWIADPGLCSGETEKVNLLCEFDFSVSHHVWSLASYTIFIDYFHEKCRSSPVLVGFLSKGWKDIATPCLIGGVLVEEFWGLRGQLWAWGDRVTTLDAGSYPEPFTKASERMFRNWNSILRAWRVLAGGMWCDQIHVLERAFWMFVEYGLSGVGSIWFGGWEILKSCCNNQGEGRWLPSTMWVVVGMNKGQFFFLLFIFSFFNF